VKTRAVRLTAITLAMWLAADGTAHACPVCVGVSDSPLAAGMNAGVLVLLGVTTVVLGGIFFAGRRIARASGGTHLSAQRPAPIGEARPEADPC
jgi:hypothetical protein